jgi:uncharacterized protein (TIGR01777 family)
VKIVITGGTGQIGTVLSRAFASDGHELSILSRRSDANGPFRVIRWDATTLGEWTRELEGADVVVNLAGRSVNCRYTQRNRDLITNSRVDSTRVLGEAIALCKRPPRVWLQASTATIYAHRYDAPNDEATGIHGGTETGVPDTWRFSIDVARSWESAANAAIVPHTRKVLLRSAITFNPDRGSAFDILLRLVRSGLGGRLGDGHQYVSWIHEADFVRAIYWLIANEAIDGAVNLAAPNPLPNAEFMRILREEWGISFGLPSPEWLLEIGALAIRTETELLLKSRRVIPGKLASQGFPFEFPCWRESARDLCQRWRELNGGNKR